ELLIMTTLLSKTIESPVGELMLVGSNAGLRAVLWPSERDGRVVFAEDVEEGDHPILDAAATQLREYISGGREDFDVPLDLVGTDFQKDVWARLAQIPYGQTSSYGELADELNKPGAARAVGAATGRNPVSIIIPCHRLVGSSGKLTGFAGGLDTKRWLLDHESPAEQFNLDA
ncbi:MAG: methylated-DNA-[protein]-cysteine S-methyltransferase, partial [Verrucomicrobiales bacterium]